MLEQLKSHIEALVFSADQPITIDEIQTTLSKLAGVEVSKFEIENHLIDLVKKFEGDDYAFQVINLASGYQFFTKNEYATTVGFRNSSS